MNDGQNNTFLIYQDDNGVSNVNVRFEGEDVWLTAEQLQMLFQASQQDVNHHIQQIYGDGELSREATNKKYLLVRNEGGRSVKRNIIHYNLDMILAIGMRIRSEVAVRFRQWAIRHLHEFTVKGFTLDDNRLKGNRNRYFRELLQRIRDIRMSERNFYQKVTDIFATSVDYDRATDITRTFFATVQNKLHYAAHKHTAAELIYERVDADKPMVGMTHFEGRYITEDDVKIAKNYLNEKELEYLRLLVSQFLDFAELQALEERPMRMEDWVAKLDAMLSLSGRQLLNGPGKISHEEACRKAVEEFREYRRREMIQYESDFDRVIRELTDKSASGGENCGK
ncbi:MAG: virulence RhuM family protein [Kiritimatiellae bacterium]|nr:virulence RhuM family protein [Kiritimatiellia bacterium]